MVEGVVEDAKGAIFCVVEVQVGLHILAEEANEEYELEDLPAHIILVCKFAQNFEEILSVKESGFEELLDQVQQMITYLPLQQLLPLVIIPLLLPQLVSLFVSLKLQRWRHSADAM